MTANDQQDNPVDNTINNMLLLWRLLHGVEAAETANIIIGEAEGDPEKFEDIILARMSRKIATDIKMEESLKLQVLMGSSFGEPYDSMPFSKIKAMYDAGEIEIK